MSTELDASMRRSRRLYEEIFGQGNYAAADELLAEDIINHGPGAPPVLGTEGIKRQAALLRMAIPDLSRVRPLWLSWTATCGKRGVTVHDDWTRAVRADGRRRVNNRRAPTWRDLFARPIVGAVLIADTGWQRPSGGIMRMPA